MTDDRERKPAPRVRFCAYCACRLSAGSTVATCCKSCDGHAQRIASKRTGAAE